MMKQNMKKWKTSNWKKFFCQKMNPDLILDQYLRNYWYSEYIKNPYHNSIRRRKS